jgi:hypothetical protein
LAAILLRIRNPGIQEGGYFRFHFRTSLLPAPPFTWTE